MRPVTSLLEPFGNLDRSSPVPLFRQIAGHFREQIRGGSLAIGQRLPAIRSLAATLGVNRSTVQMAYRELESRGVVETRVGSGTRVRNDLRARDLADPVSATEREHDFQEGPWRPRFTRPTEEAFAMLVAAEGELPESLAKLEAIDMSHLMPDESAFPVAAFRASLDRVLERDGAGLLTYGPIGGYAPLRELIAQRLTAGGTATTASEVLVTSGAQQGIDLCLRAFCESGDAVVLSAPTYHQMFGLLRGLGLEARTVLEDEHGPDDGELRTALERGGARLVYAMPNFHNPTGRTWSRATRLRFLERTDGFRGPILEDDYEEELRFTGLPEPTLRSLCSEPRVIGLGTVSKGLFPGARIGWVTAHREVIDRIAGLKRFSDLSSGLVMQAALVDFIERGEFDRHLEGVRRELARKHAQAQESLSDHLEGFARWTRPQGGYALWVVFPASVDSRELCRLAAERGLLAAPGQVFDPDRGRSSAVRLTLARCGLEQIEEGIATLSRTARELVQKPTAPRSVFV